MLEKKEIRKNIRQSILGLSADAKQQLSDITAQMVMASSAWQSAQCILLYAALPDELDTLRLIESAVEGGKQVILPVVVDSENLELRIYHPAHLHKGRYFGILEPNEMATILNENEYGIIDLALIPGRAFTLEGHRLGRGKGYYDRLLSQLKCPCYGLCFPQQIVEALPCDDWDIKMTGIFVI